MEQACVTFPSRRKALLLGLWSIVFLGGCASGGGGSAGLNENIFLLGVTAEFDQAKVDKRTTDQEYKNVSYFALSGTGQPESSVHPFEFANIYKAYGYGFSGNGQTIAIFDTGFNSKDAFEKKDGEQAFVELQGKYDAGLLQIEGSLTEQRGTRQQGHGNYVASIAAAPYDEALSTNFYPTYPLEGAGDTQVFRHGMAGVAPNAR